MADSMNLVFARDFLMSDEAKDKKWHSIFAEQRDGTWCM
jgi:hypothetical protein